MFEGKIANKIDYNEIVKKVMTEIPIYYDESKIWYRWNHQDYKWEKVDEIDILISVQQELNIANISQSNVRNQIINALQMEARKKKPKELNKNQIQYKNKIIDIITGKTTTATPEYFTFNPIPWELSEVEDTPTISDFIRSWVGEKNVKTVEEWISYNMLCNYPIHRVACFNGAGRNGKSTLIKLMKKIVGKHNISSGEMETVLFERFGAGTLYRKTGTEMGETNFQKVTKTSRFKKLTGEDTITIEYKGKDSFDYDNYAKLTISTNSLPMTDDKTDGFYSRWLIINFPNQFKERLNILKIIPEQEYKNFARKSIRLLKELLERGTFTGEGTIDERREIYEKISNPLQLYLETETIESQYQQVTKKEFNNEFKKWLKNKGYRLLSDKEISKQMSQYYEWSWKDHERVWTGIGIKSLQENYKIEHVKT